MPSKKSTKKGRDEQKPGDRAKKQEEEDVLEKALEDTFPSSDPVAVTQPTVGTKKKPRH
jgi:hypothetical protein